MDWLIDTLLLALFGDVVAQAVVVVVLVAVGLVAVKLRHRL